MNDRICQGCGGTVRGDELICVHEPSNTVWHIKCHDRHMRSMRNEAWLAQALKDKIMPTCNICRAEYLPEAWGHGDGAGWICHSCAKRAKLEVFSHPGVTEQLREQIRSKVAKLDAEEAAARENMKAVPLVPGELISPTDVRFVRPIQSRTPESDPTGRAPNTPGAKLDAGKAPLLRGCLGYFPLALAEVAKVSEYGAKKYTWKGWETVPDGVARYGDALARHLVQDGEDKDTGLLHAAHCAWNALARLELMLREKQP